MIKNNFLEELDYLSLVTLTLGKRMYVWPLCILYELSGNSMSNQYVIQRLHSRLVTIVIRIRNVLIAVNHRGTGLSCPQKTTVSALFTVAQ